MLLRSFGWSRLMIGILALLLSGRAFSQQPNLALGKPVEASAQVWPGFHPGLLADGSTATICHPLAGEGTLGFYFEVDLGSEIALDRIVLRNRADGCCPERLSDFKVEIYADGGGESGKLNWSASVRSDGSNSGPDGVDIITRENNLQGLFKGRFVRVVNQNDAPYSPQLSEIEVYGGLAPAIKLFVAEPETISSGQSTVLRWVIEGASRASISGGVGAVSPSSGSIAVSPGSSGAYTLTAGNDSGESTASVWIGVDVVPLPPVLAEFMTKNEGGLKDGDGDYSDWVELENPNPFQISLSGYFLTDNPSQPRLWPFPDIGIPALGRLVVFASGKNRNDASDLHSNFKLDDEGEYLALSGPAGRVLQQYPANYPASRTFPAQVKDVSYGLGTNGTAGFFRIPTPGAANGQAYQGVVADTKFSADRGFYEASFSVAISSATPGAVIRYTLNSQEPTAATGTIYSAPIAITNTTVLRAAAFKEGWAPTGVDTHTYIFPSNVVAGKNMQASITRNPAYSGRILKGLMDVPSISIAAQGTINGGAEVKGSIEWILAGGQAGFQEECGIRHFGGAFTEFAKKNFRLYFRGEYGAAKLHYPLFNEFGLGWRPAQEFNQIELRGGSHDMRERGFYMANIFTDDTLLEMGQLNPHGRFVHLYLNGAYWGLYHLRERWDAAMHQSYLGGARENYESINGNWNVGGWAEPGSPYDGDGSAWFKIKQERGNYASVKSLLDVRQYIDFMLMWMFGGSEDEYRAVGPKTAGSGFKFYLNDADGWFCGPWYCAADNRTGRSAPGRQAGDGPGSLFSMLNKEGHPEFKVLLADQIYSALFGQGALTPGRTTARLARRAAEIEDAFVPEAARWNYLTPAEWSSRRNYSLTNWLQARPAEVLSQFRAAGFYPRLDAPVFSQQGGVIPSGFQPVFQPVPNAAIYFTVDGSDPRLPGGAPSPSAQRISSGATAQTLIPAGSRWKWLTDGAGLGSSAVVSGHPDWSGSNWKHPQFNDAAWAEGAGELGFGDGGEATVIPSGGQTRFITAYFRRAFTLARAGEIRVARIRIRRDDGAIIYINGSEAARTGISAGEKTYGSFADPASDDGATFIEIDISASLLQEGANQISVELHQSSASSSDASFDLELIVIRAEGPETGNMLPVLGKNTVIKARAFDGSQWSALNSAFFQVGPNALAAGDLAVAELHYDAKGNDHEFLELANLSDRAVNLREARFVEGIEYSFPTNRDTTLAPGQRLTLARDLFRFQQRFGIEAGANALLYSQSLAREGERITLVNAGNETVLSFAYLSAPPWPANRPDENFSLVLAHPELGMGDPLAWRSSLNPEGAPGLPDTLPFAANPDEDADGDGFPALVEYALGWSDDEPNLNPLSLNPFIDQFGRFLISFPRRLDADAARIVCEASTDLIHWAPAALLGSVREANGFVRETWAVSASVNPECFLRLRVLPSGN